MITKIYTYNNFIDITVSRYIYIDNPRADICAIAATVGLDVAVVREVCAGFERNGDIGQLRDRFPVEHPRQPPIFADLGIRDAEKMLAILHWTAPDLVPSRHLDAFIDRYGPSPSGSVNAGLSAPHS